MNVLKRRSEAFQKLLLLGTSLIIGGAAVSEAATLHIPGFVEVNQYSLPAGVPVSLGDVMFSDDGMTLYILGGSESNASGVWTVPVIRDASGAVTGLGAATRLFALPQMDTGLESMPGTDTLFFRITGGVVGERRPDGSVATFLATGASFTGGLALVPDPLPNAGDLLVGNFNSGIINSHSLIDNSDGTFTPVMRGFFSNSAFGAAGDMAFIPSGNFANDLMYTNWNGGTVSIIDIDPSTGTPVGGGAAPSVTLFASGLGNGPWGLDFDPVSGDLFIANFGGNPSDGIVQISGFPSPANINRPPAAECQNVTVPADPGICTASVASVDAGSSDPDGDPITLTQSPAGPYPVGSTMVTLTAIDDRGGSNSCSAVVTVADQTPPTITASLELISRKYKRNGRKKARFRVNFSAVDNCGLTSPTTAVLNAPGCAPIPVMNGEIVIFKAKDKRSCKVKYKRGILRIKARSLTLDVTAEDAGGFTTISVEVPLPGHDRDDDDDD